MSFDLLKLEIVMEKIKIILRVFLKEEKKMIEKGSG